MRNITRLKSSVSHRSPATINGPPVTRVKSHRAGELKLGPAQPGTNARPLLHNDGREVEAGDLIAGRTYKVRI